MEICFFMVWQIQILYLDYKRGFLKKKLWDFKWWKKYNIRLMSTNKTHQENYSWRKKIVFSVYKNGNNGLMFAKNKATW